MQKGDASLFFILLSDAFDAKKPIKLVLHEGEGK